MTGTADIRETRWETSRPPGGAYDHIRVHRYRTAGPAKAALLYLPGTNMNGQVALRDEDHNLWIFLARRGVEVYAIDYRTAFPISNGVSDLGFMAEWTVTRSPRTSAPPPPSRARRAATRSCSCPASAAGRSSPTRTQAWSRTAWPAS